LVLQNSVVEQAWENINYQYPGDVGSMNLKRCSKIIKIL